MRRRLNSGDERGQSLVEVALVLPILLLLLAGIIEFGWFFNGQLTLTGAAREGAREAAVSVSDQNRDNRIAEAIKRHVEGLSGFSYDTNTVYGTKQQLESAELGTGKVLAAADFGTDGEVRVFIRGRMSPLVGIAGLSSRDLWADAVMRTE